MGASNAISVQDVRGTSVTMRESAEGPRVEVGTGKDGEPLMEVTFTVVDGIPAVKVRSRGWSICAWNPSSPSSGSLFVLPLRLRRE